MRFALKDGAIAQVRRPGRGDETELADFYRRTAFGISDAFATSGSTASAIDDVLCLAESQGCDAAIAVVDAKIVGLASYEPEPAELEQPVSSGILDDLARDEVCVSRINVSDDERGRGIGTCLKYGLVQSAWDAGYKGVVSETGSAAVKAMIRRMIAGLGGRIEHDDPGIVRTWTLVLTQDDPGRFYERR